MTPRSVSSPHHHSSVVAKSTSLLPQFSLKKFQSYISHHQSRLIDSSLSQHRVFTSTAIPRFIPQHVYWFDCIDSTHRLIKDSSVPLGDSLVSQNQQHTISSASSNNKNKSYAQQLNTLIIASSQTAGVGRIKERTWVSQQGGLYFSFSLGWQDLREVFRFRMCVAVALVLSMRDVICGMEGTGQDVDNTVLSSSSGVTARGGSIATDLLWTSRQQETNNTQHHIKRSQIILKWPNDLYYINEKTGKSYKLGGMLMDNELSSGNTRQNHGTNNVDLSDASLYKIKCFTGIGINVNQENWSQHFPEGESLRGLTGQTYETEKVLAHFFNTLRTCLNVSSLKELEKQYRDVLGGLNQTVKVMPKRKEGQEFYYARVVDVSEEGNLVVIPENSTERRELISEEVSLRPVLSATDDQDA